MVGHACSPTSTVYVYVTLTQSEIKVKVTKHLTSDNCPQVHISRSISSATFAWISKLMCVSDSMGPYCTNIITNALIWQPYSTYVYTSSECDNLLFTIIIRFFWNEPNEWCRVSLHTDRWKSVSLSLTFMAPAAQFPMLSKPCFTLKQ